MIILIIVCYYFLNHCYPIDLIHCLLLLFIIVSTIDSWWYRLWLVILLAMQTPHVVRMLGWCLLEPSLFRCRGSSGGRMHPTGPAWCLRMGRKTQTPIDPKKVSQFGESNSSKFIKSWMMGLERHHFQKHLQPASGPDVWRGQPPEVPGLGQRDLQFFSGRLGCGTSRLVRGGRAPLLCGIWGTVLTSFTVLL